MTQKNSDNNDDDKDDKKEAAENKGGLFKGLGDIFNTPLPELIKRSKESAEDDNDQEESLLEKIGDIFNTPLPDIFRPKDTDEPTKEKKPTPDPTPKPKKETDGWEITPIGKPDAPHAEDQAKSKPESPALQTLKRKQAQEWEAMKQRHQAEEQNLKLAHEQQLKQARQRR